MPRYQLIISLMACFAVVTYVLSYRFVIHPSPQGADTPNYLFVTSLLLEKFDLRIILGVGRELTYLLILIVGVVTEGLVGLTFKESMMTVPVALGLAYCASVFYFVRKLHGHDALAVSASLMSGLSVFLIRLSYDLYAQLFGLTLMVLFLTKYSDFIIEQTKVEYYLLMILNLAVLLANAYMWLFTVAVLVMHTLLSILAGQPVARSKLKAVIFLLGLLYILFVYVSGRLGLQAIPSQWYERVSGTPTFLSGIFYPYQVGEATLLTLPESWNWIAGWESPSLVILSVLGSYVMILLAHLSRYHRLVSSWLFTSTLVLLITGYTQAYRSLILIPIGILSAEGLFIIARAISKWHCLLRITEGMVYVRKLLPPPNLVLSAVVVFITLNFTLSHAFIGEYVYYPNEAGVAQLLEIRKAFGYANHSVVILVEPTPYFVENRFQWARALTGMDVYLGSLSQFLQAQPFKLINVQVKLDPSLKKTILIPSALYNIGNERILAKEAFRGVLIINCREVQRISIDEIVRKGAKWLDESFEQGWYLFTNTLPHNASVISETFIISTEHLVLDGWATYEKKIEGALTGTKFIISLKGHLMDVVSIIEVWYKDDTASGFALRNFTSDAAIMYDVILDPAKSIDRVRIAIYSQVEKKVVKPQWLQIFYLAIL